MGSRPWQITLKNQGIMLYSYASYYYLLHSGVGTIMMLLRSLVMVDECSFCAKQHSTDIARNMILARTDSKGMALCPIGAFIIEESLPFLTNLPQSQVRHV